MDEILELSESVSEGFSTYSCYVPLHKICLLT